ncbi:MAG: Tic20 family protein [Cyanobacteriota bacterium]|nr:Tic20 family protein [Cyanobacteriota bacterium]
MDGPPIWQRALAALAYSLPWSDALGFGTPLLSQFPWLNLLILPGLPMLQIEQLFSVGGFGLGSLLVFLVLYGAVVRNPRVPYAVRFNVLLALMIDILLVVVQLAMQILFRETFGNNLLLRTLDNTIFLGALLLLSFALVECLRGKEPDVPTLSEAVRIQLY